MEDFSGYTSFNYLAEDNMLTNFCQLAENISHALPKNESTRAIADQVKKLKAKKEKWPENFFATWLARVIPMFTQETILKLIQAYLSWVEEVNETRKRQREALKFDIDRKKLMLDTVDQKRLTQQDTFQSLVLTTEADMTWFAPWEQDYVRLEGKLNAATNAFNNAQTRLMNHELQLREDLRALELDFIPIRYLSSQSNVKSHIVKKQNHSLDWITHDDKYILIQNSTCPPESVVLQHVSWEPESKLSNLPL